MQCYFVKRQCTVRVGRIVLQREAAPEDMLKRSWVPSTHIFCGQVHWEIRAITEICGKDALEVIPVSKVMGLLPSLIEEPSQGQDLKAQLLDIRRRQEASERPQAAGASLRGSTGSRVFRIVLINGTGTMLGDNLVGAGVFHRLQQALVQEGLELRLTVVLGVNAAFGSESLWKRWPWVEKVYPCGVSLKTLQAFDASFDFSALLRKKGYSSENFFDFYIYHFGAKQEAFLPAERNPAIRIQQQALQEAKGFLAAALAARMTEAKAKHIDQSPKVVLLQSSASTPARSMSKNFVKRLLHFLFQSNQDQVVLVLTFDPVPEGLEPFAEQLIACAPFSTNSIDRFLALVFCADEVLSVDSLALHVAMGLGKPGTAFFALSPPEIRLRYAPQIRGVLIPGAAQLPYWEKHKADEAWETWEASYEKAWDAVAL